MCPKKNIILNKLEKELIMFQIYDIFEPSEESKPAANGRDSHGRTLTEMPDGRIMVAW